MVAEPTPDPSMASGGRDPTRLRRILRADAGWDTVLGVAFCLASWPTTADALALPHARPAPPYLVLGVGCLVAAVLLVATAGGGRAFQVARAAAIGNAGFAVAVIVGLMIFTPSVTVTALLLFVVLGCGVFAWLQWTTPRTPMP